jgi:ADP-ribose pyrophosphatase YjhB (NUDIX family)
LNSNLSGLLDAAISHVLDAKQGLPQELFYFVSRMTPMVNVDLLIKNKVGQTLLTWREDEFYGPAWHIPGGIIRFKERIEDRIAKVANSEVGCGVRFSADPINVRGMINTNRDIRGHFISLVYLCELDGVPTPSNEAKADTPLAGQWLWHNFAPKNLISVHEPFRKFINDTPPL